MGTSRIARGGWVRETMRAWLCGGVILAAVGVAACSERASTDLVPDIPATQQRRIDRSDLGIEWPFTVGRGTLACADGVVVFRHEGSTYALNETGASRRYARVDSIQLVPSPGPPRDPLTRINQDQRQKIFGSVMRCERTTVEAGAASDPCRHELRARHRLTEAELEQIEAEGRERLWPPLERRPARLEPLVDIGLKLCPGA